MEWTSNVNFCINDDAQLVVTTTHPPGMGYSAPPVVLPREESLSLALCTIARRVNEGTVDAEVTVRIFLLRLGYIVSHHIQEDRVLIEQYVDNDTGET